METELKIYEKFIILFYEKGFNNVDVCSSLSENKISTEVFHKYFNNKNSILYRIYENIYLDLITNLDKLSKLVPYSLDRFQFTFDFLCEFVSNNVPELYIIRETLCKLPTILNSDEIESLKLLSKSVHDKELKIIYDCKVDKYIKDINSCIILNLLIFVMDTELNRNLNKTINLPTLDELKTFFWNTILQDTI